MIDNTTADYCPCCGQPREKEGPVERFGLMLRGNFLHYQGRRERITQGLARFVRLLIERGAATHEYIVLRICPEAESNVRQVYANRFRRALKELTGDSIRLHTHHSWGYELIQADAERLAA